MENSPVPFNTVMIRRGTRVARGIPARRLGSYILEKKILCTDEVSGDGLKWIRADQLRHLAPYFLRKTPVKENQEAASIFPQTESGQSQFAENPPDEIHEVPHSPPGVENELARLARMLEDINK
jgi:hypothetical protein